MASCDIRVGKDGRTGAKRTPDQPTGGVRMELVLMPTQAVQPEPKTFATASPDALDVIQWRTPTGTLRAERPTPGLLHERLWETQPVRRGV